ncbi:MAG: LamG domain-containing protein, partial [Verrucomicrobiales bacterium]
LLGGARVEGGVLRLNGRTSAALSPLLDRPLRDKTLLAWVKLDGLNQRGGGVVTLQTPNGAVFDAIVIGEQETAHWLAGSNNFQRTQPLRGAAETEAGGTFVAVAVTYAADGRIAFYRNGKPYGESYLSKGLQAYEAGDCNLSLGMRHSPGGGNKHLAGAISRVRVYDRALSSSDVALASDADPGGPTDEELLTRLSPEEQANAADWKRRMESLESRIAELEKETGAAGDPWTALAHSFLNLKELIYLR